MRRIVPIKQRIAFEAENPEICSFVKVTACHQIFRRFGDHTCFAAINDTWPIVDPKQLHDEPQSTQ
ncbi:hypothetical protein FHS21_004662 [Phyllobacterium trifolii]|uniref:Uncharacterized protein n=1 Tax=Phyllobacterium trifolii TaxID=300193 RepID=A0A839UI48_9HYPH|nr:hypothetical protein [Phyllobacterium trifolii]